MFAIMKSRSLRRLLFIALINCCSSLPAETPPLSRAITIKTARFAFDFQVGDDRRLYQRAIGSADANEKLERLDEAYPQAGDGYVWEPALQVVHADGNTSTALLYEGTTRTNEAAQD